MVHIIPGDSYFVTTRYRLHFVGDLAEPSYCTTVAL